MSCFAHDDDDFPFVPCNNDMRVVFACGGGDDDDNDTFARDNNTKNMCRLRS